MYDFEGNCELIKLSKILNWQIGKEFICQKNWVFIEDIATLVNL